MTPTVRAAERLVRAVEAASRDTGIAAPTGSASGPAAAPLSAVMSTSPTRPDSPAASRDWLRVRGRRPDPRSAFDGDRPRLAGDFAPRPALLRGDLEGRGDLGFDEAGDAAVRRAFLRGLAALAGREALPPASLPRSRELERVRRAMGWSWLRPRAGRFAEPLGVSELSVRRRRVRRRAEEDAAARPSRPSSASCTKEVVMRRVRFWDARVYTSTSPVSMSTSCACGCACACACVAGG